MRNDTFQRRPRVPCDWCGDGGLVLPGAVEGVHLERGIDARPQLGGRAGQQAGGVGQFIEQGGVLGSGAEPRLPDSFSRSSAWCRQAPRGRGPRGD
jgi:hypothetical protein